MYNPLRDYKALARLQVDRLAFEVDDKMTVEHKEELVIVVVLVPMVFTLHDTRRTTDSFTLQSVWLYQSSVHAFTRAETSTTDRAGNLISRYVA